MIIAKGRREAVMLALRLAEYPPPAIPFEVEQEKYKHADYAYGSSSEGEDYDYISKYGNFTDDKSAYAWDDDWLLDLEKYNKTKGTRSRSNDKFGGLERDDDDLFAKSADKGRRRLGMLVTQRAGEMTGTTSMTIQLKKWHLKRQMEKYSVMVCPIVMLGICVRAGRQNITSRSERIGVHCPTTCNKSGTSTHVIIF